MRISTNAETHNLADEETPEEQKDTDLKHSCR
jgi:hypothetical protein